MKATKFYRLKDISGNADFHRKKVKDKDGNIVKGKYNVPGVYCWGFTLNDSGSLPTNKDELVLYYIGKDTRSVVRRIMEEVTQMIFGGYGTILDPSWLENNPFCAQISVKQESDKKGTQPVDPEVLYKADGLHVLYDYHCDPHIQKAVHWMRDRLIFAWIPVDDPEELAALELELHSYATTNILGTMGRVNFPHNSRFNSIDWSCNEVWKEWLLKVKATTERTGKSK